MVAATLACLIVYGLYDDVNGYVHLSQSVKDLYNTTHRTVWGACVGWVVFACATGNGGEFLYIVWDCWSDAGYDYTIMYFNFKLK